MLLARIKVVAVILVVAAVAACAGSDPSAAPALHSVIDGDTIVVEVGGRTETVRLLGIDTPESVDPNRPIQCFGPESTQRLSELLPDGTPLRLERDREARDQFDRLLAYVFRLDDGLFVNEALLAEGYADVSIYEPNNAYRRRLEAALGRARTADVGLWSSCGGPDVPLDPP